jgi:hypothetical protein
VDKYVYLTMWTDALHTVPYAGYALFRLHVSVLFLLIGLYSVFPSLRKPIFFLYIPILFFHLTQKHCPITKLERSLHKEDITILDPLMTLMGIPISRANRNRFQVIASVTIFLGFAWFLPA